MEKNCKHCRHFSMDSENANEERQYALSLGRCQLRDLPTYGNSGICSCFEHSVPPTKDENQLELFG